MLLNNYAVHNSRISTDMIKYIYWCPINSHSQHDTETWVWYTQTPRRGQITKFQIVLAVACMQFDIHVQLDLFWTSFFSSVVTLVQPSTIFDIYKALLPTRTILSLALTSWFTSPASCESLSHPSSSSSSSPLSPSHFCSKQKLICSTNPFAHVAVFFKFLMFIVFCFCLLLSLLFSFCCYSYFWTHIKYLHMTSYLIM